MADVAAEQRDDRLRKGDGASRVQDVVAAQPVRDHGQRHVGDRRGRRRDLHEIAEEQIDLGVPAADLVPPVLEPHPAGLRAEVRVLRPGHLVTVDVRRAAADVGLERRVVATHGLPVARQGLQDFGVEPGIVRGAGQCCGHRAEIGLRRQPAHRVEGAVDRVGARVDGGQHAGGGDAARVVRVEVDRQPHLVAQRLHQRPRRARLAHARHVLDAEDLGARLLELSGEVDVVAEAPLWPRRVEQIARVAHRRLAQRAGLAHGVDGDPHVVDPVQGIEDAEQIDARARRLPDEVLHHVVGIARVADRVRGPDHHLQDDVGHGLAQARHPLPGVLAQEAEHDVERRAAPAFEGKELRRQTGVGRRDGQEVVGANPRRQQRLLRVAHGGVGEECPPSPTHLGDESLRTELAEPIATARWDRRVRVVLGHPRRGQGRRRPRAPAHLGIAVDDHLAQELQEPGEPVGLRRGVDELGRLVDEPRGVRARRERVVRDHVTEKVEIGGHALNARLAEGPGHAPDRLLRRVAPRRQLHEQGIVVRRDEGAGEHGSVVDADPEAGRRLARGEPAMSGREAPGRILRRHAALERVAGERDRLLRRHARRRIADARAGGDAELRLDEVDPGHLFGDGVLDLQARVGLDEVERAGLDVQQELDASGVRVAGGAPQRERRGAEPPSVGLAQEWRRRPLDDLLMAALHRAIPLEQVHQIAVQIAENLHLDVTRAPHELLDVHRVVAEGAGRFAPRRVHEGPELGRRRDDPDAAATAAVAGLEHEGIADGLRDGAGLAGIARQGAAPRQDRHARCLRQRARRDLVAERAHRLRRRAHEDEAGARARHGEVRALGEEAVARMDGVHPRPARHPDDRVDVEIGVDRRALGADEIALVRDEAMARAPILG